MNEILSFKSNENSSSHHRIRTVSKKERDLNNLQSDSNKIENDQKSSLKSETDKIINIQESQNEKVPTLFANCDNKINYCNRLNGFPSGHYDYNRKLSIDDESSQPINATNTNNKSERKRNINMLNDIYENVNRCDSSVGDDHVIVSSGNTKRMKVDCDGQDNNKSKMYQIYQPWVLLTYGDQSKSKTITLKKQSRILSTLKGLESNRPDSSKFRFWVKSKGFVMELPLDFKNVKENQFDDDNCLLFIPCKSESSKVSSFKRVAIVEYFFNIIYKVHCSVDEGEGRHVGQKKTYRKITEYYAFLPREAVTKFLTQCSECRRSMKTTIVREISEIEENKACDNDNVNDKSEDYPKNIENYYLLLKALYDNSLNHRVNRVKSLKENNNNNIHLDIKDESDAPSNEKKSLDTATNTENEDDKNSDSNKTDIALQKETVNQQLSTSSSMHDDDKNSKNIICNDALARAASYIGNENENENNNNNHRVMMKGVPDDDNCNIKDENYDYDGIIKHTTCNSNKISSDHADGENDYHRKGIIITTSSSIETLPSPSSRRAAVAHLTGDIRPITSTYLLMTRSMGLTDEDALNLDSISSSQSENNHETTLNLEDSYANLLKDADKLKLMLLAWNYQNSAAIRNNATGPDLTTMTNLWEQYQNALTGMNSNKSNTDGTAVGSPSPSQSQEEANSPIDNIKEDEEVSEDESDERIDQTAYDPERLKAFNMFVRLFVDENLDRMVPISKQPKEKVQAIIDSCARQFPEFSERARKRLRTYLKSCRRNKKTKDGWENQPSRPTPAHLTSVQAEQILAIACENESLNAKRMRLGMEPISQSLNIPSSHSNDSQSGPSLYTMAKSSSSSSSTTVDPTQPLTISTNVANCKTSPIISTTTDSNANSICSIINTSRSTLLPTTSTSFDFGQAFLQKNNQNSSFYSSSVVNNNTNMSQGPTDLSIKRPLLPHNLNVTEAAAVKQLITGYREAAAFLLRSADELEQLLLNQQS